MDRPGISPQVKEGWGNVYSNGGHSEGFSQSYYYGRHFLLRYWVFGRESGEGGRGAVITHNHEGQQVERVILQFWACCIPKLISLAQVVLDAQNSPKTLTVDCLGDQFCEEINPSPTICLSFNIFSLTM